MYLWDKTKFTTPNIKKLNLPSKMSEMKITNSKERKCTKPKFLVQSKIQSPPNQFFVALRLTQIYQMNYAKFDLPSKMFEM